MQCFKAVTKPVPGHTILFDEPNSAYLILQSYKSDLRTSNVCMKRKTLSLFKKKEKKKLTHENHRNNSSSKPESE